MYFQPFVWHFKEGPSICIEKGSWPQLLELYRRADGRIFGSPETRDSPSCATAPARAACANGYGRSASALLSTATCRRWSHSSAT